MNVSCASMDPSWLQAIPANVRRNQSGRPASSRRLSSCKSLSLKSFDLENRGFAGGALAAVGTALETPPLSGPKLAHLLAGLTDGSVWGGASADRLIPSAAASTALWKLSANKDQSRRASDSGLRKHHSQLRAVPPKGDLSGEASLPGGVLGATLDPPRKEEVATGKAVLAAIVGDLAAPNAVSASEPIEELTSAALTSAVRPVIARRRSALPQRNGEERKGAVGGQKTTLEKATAGGGTTKTKPSITGETATGTTVGILQKIVPPGIVEEIGPWSTSESRRRESSKGTVPDFSRRESDDFSAIERGESSYNAASADIDDISDDVSGDDASSSSSESDLAERSAELASFSGRGIPILDPSSGCADLPFRDFMPLGRLRGGSRGSASIGALQKPSGPPGVWLVSSTNTGCAPTMAFNLDGGDQLLWSVRPAPLVKIVPAGNNSVKAAFKDAGFRRVTAEATKWDMLWSGKALKVDDFKGLNKNQKVNHFPGTWELGRKDHLYKHLAAAARRHPQQYDFLPSVFLLPEDHAEWVEDSKRDAQQLYILKPRSSSRGRGVRLLRKPAELTKMRPSLVQKYVSNPHLINGYKYDLRLYVVVTSWDPLRVYVYKEGLVRFASEKYGLDRANLRKRCAHITNTSINNKGASAEDGATVAAKWSLSALEAYFESEGISFGHIWEEIRGVVLKTLIAVEGKVASLCQAHLPHRNNGFELYGFDVLLDAELKPWLLEVNTGPALHCPTALDKEIKFKLIRDTLHLVGFCPYDRDALAKEEEENRRMRLLGLEGRRGKGAREEDARVLRRDLQSLDDVSFVAATSGRPPLLIQEGESENARRSDFERLYPDPDAERWGPLFESQRFNNTLYARWLRLQNEQNPPQANRLRRSTSGLSQTADSENGGKPSARSVGTPPVSSKRSARSRNTAY